MKVVACQWGETDKSQICGGVTTKQAYDWLIGYEGWKKHKNQDFLKN